MIDPIRMLAVSATLSMVLIGLTAVSSAEDFRPKRLTDEERQACLADGGRIAIMGLSGAEGCSRPMADAGKQCTDGSQCLAHRCVIEDWNAGVKASKNKRKVAGTCAKNDYGFGCQTFISNGHATSICVD